jgi:hypothetical protein
MGFIRNEAKHCLYKKDDDGRSLLLGVYVDGILIAGQSRKSIEEVKSKPTKGFVVEDLGHVSKFLGMEFSQENNSVGIGMNGYINDLLEEFGMADCGPARVPMSTGIVLDSPSEETACAVKDPSLHLSLMGKLLFASFTGRPDICFTITKLSRYLQDPREIHMKAAFQVLRYLQGAKEFVLKYRQESKLNIQAFTIPTGRGTRLKRRVPMTTN